MNPRSALLLLVCSFLSFAAGPDPQAAGMNAQRLAAIPARMKEYVDANQTAGTVTIIARHGKVASFEAVGYQDLESKKPMRKDSMFRIASLTKPITCAGIMVLVDEGRISVIDPVEKFLPEYKGIKVRACSGLSAYDCTGVAPSRAINIEDLMMHTSGLEGNVNSHGGTEPATLAELAALGAKTQLLFDPGTHWSYSNVGYNILGRIIEIVSKQPYDAFLEQRIFEPLGMKDTSFFPPDEKLDRLATLYTLTDGGLKRAAGAVRRAPRPQNSDARGRHSEHRGGYLPLQYDDAQQRHARRAPCPLERSRYADDHLAHRRPQSGLGARRRPRLWIRGGAERGKECFATTPSAAS